MPDISLNPLDVDMTPSPREIAASGIPMVGASRKVGTSVFSDNEGLAVVKAIIEAAQVQNVPVTYGRANGHTVLKCHSM